MRATLFGCSVLISALLAESRPRSVVSSHEPFLRGRVARRGSNDDGYGYSSAYSSAAATSTSGSGCLQSGIVTSDYAQSETATCDYGESSPKTEVKQESYTSLPAIAAVQSFPSIFNQATTCDKTHPKSEIIRFIGGCRKDLEGRIQSLTGYNQSISSANAQDVAAQILVGLNSINTVLKAGVDHVQSCGIDPQPLIADNGVSVTAIASSAFSLVTSLELVFTTVSDLYKQYPVVEQTCSATLTKVSTSLAAIVATCSEQMNMFDVGFFRLVGGNLKEFQSIPNQFDAFIGSFSN